MGNMANSNMGIMGGGFYSGPVGPMMGPMMGPGPSPEMMNMNQMMMFGGVSCILYKCDWAPCFSTILQRGSHFCFPLCFP